MEISKGMQQAIAQKDLIGIYSSFYTIIIYDPGFATGQFDETLKYVKSLNIPGFMKQYNGKPFKPETEWTVDYYDIVASQLMDNFCQERIDFLHRMGRKLYPQVRPGSPAGGVGQQNYNAAGAGQYGQNYNAVGAGQSGYNNAARTGQQGSNYNAAGSRGNAGNMNGGGSSAYNRQQGNYNSRVNDARNRSHENAEAKNETFFADFFEKIRDLIEKAGNWVVDKLKG